MWCDDDGDDDDNVDDDDENDDDGIHSKSEKVCGTTFSVKKYCGKSV